MKITVKTIGGSTIGDSLILIILEGRKVFKVIVDCGWQSNLVKLDKFINNLATVERELPIDAILLTHAHADHSAGLVPLLLIDKIKRDKNLYCYCTNETKELFLNVIFKEKLTEIKRTDLTKDEKKYLKGYYQKNIFDYLNNKIKPLNELKDNKIEIIKPPETLNISSIPAGHILGAVSYYLTWKNGNNKKFNILITGDICFHNQYTVEGSKLFDYIKSKVIDINLLITEGTYDLQNQETSRDDLIKNFIGRIQTFIEEKRRILIPVYSIGRAQEILTILLKKQINNVPIFLGGRALDALDIYIKYLSNKLCELSVNQEKEISFNRNNSVKFKVYNKNVQEDNFEEINGPAIFLASSGMLETGSVSHTIFTHMNSNDRIILVGWDGEEGKPGSVRNILTVNNRFKFDSKKDIFHLSAHTNGSEILNLISEANIQNIIIVHRGNKPNQESKLSKELKKERRNVFLPNETNYEFSIEF